MGWGSRGNTCTQRHINILIPAAFGVIATATTKIAVFKHVTLKVGCNTFSETEDTGTCIHMAKGYGFSISKIDKFSVPQFRLFDRRMAYC